MRATSVAEASLLGMVLDRDLVLEERIIDAHDEHELTSFEPVDLCDLAEVLQDGRYTFQTENPPLSRVVLAILPF